MDAFLERAAASTRALRASAWEVVSQLRAHPQVAAVLSDGQRLLAPLQREAAAGTQRLLSRVDTACEGVQPAEIVLCAVAVTLSAVWLLSILARWWSSVKEDGGLLVALFAALRQVPFVQGYIRKEKVKMRQQLQAARGSSSLEPSVKLPWKGKATSKVIEDLARRQREDTQVSDGASQLSGAVYMGSTAHKQMLNEAFCMFATTNPLHADVWPSVRQMESEVVSMTASFLGGGPGTSVCGAMTSGGSESILLAMKAARDWAKATRGVRHPEMIIAKSAHAAYIKAAEYFKIKLITLPVGRDFRLSARAVRSAMTKNTVVVVASAPCFPHGVVDDVDGIAKLCYRARVCLHVDACLGGFVLPFAARLGRPIPPFDFKVKGVTSMSVDTHKFGLAHKGSSVVLYANPELRAHQFTSITDWTGGLYISPTMAGSRPGGLIVTAWAAMQALGEEGYLKMAAHLYQLRDKFIEGIKASVPEIQVLGHPDMCLVAFTNSKKAPKLNIYKVKDLWSKSGWHCNALQGPPALHFCFTPAHVGGSRDVVTDLLTDLKKACEKLGADPDSVQGGSAPMYGMANVMPDRRMLGDFLVAYQEFQLDT